MKALFRSLLRLIEEVAPRFFDDLMKQLDLIWDGLGLFGPIVALIGVGSLVSVAVYFHTPLQQLLPSMRDSARRDVDAEPVLELTPRPGRWQRIIGARSNPLSIRLDAEGLRIERRRTFLAIAWADVRKWNRYGLADWKLWQPDGPFRIHLKTEHGLTAADLKRIDDRLALFITDRPEAGLDMRRLQQVLVSLRVGLRRLRGLLPDAASLRPARKAKNERSAAGVGSSAAAATARVTPIPVSQGSPGSARGAQSESPTAHPGKPDPTDPESEHDTEG